MTIPSLLQDAIRRQLKKEPRWKQAIAPPEKGAKPPSRSTGLPGSSQQTTGSGFDESDYTLRQYWPAVAVAVSSDGLIVIEAEPIKSVALLGGGAATFKEPV